MSISPKERLIRVLNQQKVDRPPVICPGGMMNAAIVDVMNQTGHTLPEAHHDEHLMAQLAYDVYDLTGFENFGIPFCLTVEAEILGSSINYGTLSCEPKIEKEVFGSVTQVEYRPISQMLQNPRVNAVVQAGYQLSKKYPDVPVIGNLTGPLSTAASIVDPIPFLKELRKEKAEAHRVVDYVTDTLIAFAQLMVDNGATLITIADPTATGEILGPQMFEEYAVRYLNKLIAGIHAFKVPVIVHICGNMNRVKPLIPQINAQAISTDAMVSLSGLKAEFPEITTMGNLSTYLLEFGTADKVARNTENLVRDGVNIIAPACGLSTSSALSNIQAMTGAVKG